MTAATAQGPVNLDLALERVLGNRQLLGRVLARFRDEYRGAAGAIGQALAAGDVEEARRLAHTLKGAAPMIGAHDLHGRARTLEQLLRERSNEATAELARLAAELERVMRSLDGILATG